MHQVDGKMLVNKLNYPILISYKIPKGKIGHLLTQIALLRREVEDHKLKNRASNSSFSIEEKSSTPLKKRSLPNANNYKRDYMAYSFFILT